MRVQDKIVRPLIDSCDQTPIAGIPQKVVFIIIKKFIFSMEAAATAATATTFDDIPSELFIQYILPFVGRHQYRFVAAVNHNFHTAYVTAFPKKVTRFNVSTIEHAKICFDEWKIMEYLHQSFLCDIAAREGNLSVLKYLRSIQCEWGEWTCSYAAKSGHLDVIKWCHENGCPWDSRTCSKAAENGHLDVIKWCRQNGCPWYSSTCTNAAENHRYCLPDDVIVIDVRHKMLISIMMMTI
jgi:hypothetical protein